MNLHANSLLNSSMDIVGIPQQEPILILDKFVQQPFVEFGSVVLGESKIVNLRVKNQSHLDQQISVEKIPTEDGFSVREVDFVVKSQSADLLIPIIWEPKQKGPIRKQVIFMWNHILQKKRLAVIVMGTAVETLKPSKNNSTLNTSTFLKKSAKLDTTLNESTMPKQRLKLAEPISTTMTSSSSSTKKRPALQDLNTNSLLPQAKKKKVEVTSEKKIMLDLEKRKVDKMSVSSQVKQLKEWLQSLPIDEILLKTEIEHVQKEFKNRCTNKQNRKSLSGLEQTSCVYFNAEKIQLLLKWVQSVCATYGVPIENFSTSFTPQRKSEQIFKLIVNFYRTPPLSFEQLFPEEIERNMLQQLQEEEEEMMLSELEQSRIVNHGNVSFTVQGYTSREHRQLREAREADEIVPNEREIISKCATLCQTLVNYRLKYQFHSHATKIQAFFKMIHTRHQYRKMKQGLLTLQRMCKQFLVTVRNRKLQSMIQLQSFSKMILCKKQYSFTCVLQSVIRCKPIVWVKAPILLMSELQRNALGKLRIFSPLYNTISIQYKSLVINTKYLKLQTSIQVLQHSNSIPMIKYHKYHSIGKVLQSLSRCQLNYQHYQNGLYSISILSPITLQQQQFLAQQLKTIVSLQQVSRIFYPSFDLMQPLQSIYRQQQSQQQFTNASILYLQFIVQKNTMYSGFLHGKYCISILYSTQKQQQQQQLSPMHSKLIPLQSHCRVYALKLNKCNYLSVCRRMQQQQQLQQQLHIQSVFILQVKTNQYQMAYENGKHKIHELCCLVRRREPVSFSKLVYLQTLCRRRIMNQHTNRVYPSVLFDMSRRSIYHINVSFIELHCQVLHSTVKQQSIMSKQYNKNAVLCNQNRTKTMYQWYHQSLLGMVSVLQSASRRNMYHIKSFNSIIPLQSICKTNTKSNILVNHLHNHGRQCIQQRIVYPSIDLQTMSKRQLVSSEHNARRIVAYTPQQMKHRNDSYSQMNQFKHNSRVLQSCVAIQQHSKSMNSLRQCQSNGMTNYHQSMVKKVNRLQHSSFTKHYVKNQYALGKTSIMLQSICKSFSKSCVNKSIHSYALQSIQRIHFQSVYMLHSSAVMQLHFHTTLQMIPLQSIVRQYLQQQQVQVQKQELNYLLIQQHNAATLIQKVFRGYSIRKHNQDKVNQIASRIAYLSKNVDEKMKLGNRTRRALQIVMTSKLMTQMKKACESLDYTTQYSLKCCESCVQEGAVPVLFALIKSCNRSQPHLELLCHALNILKHLSKTAYTSNAVFECQDSLSVLVEQLQMYRDKEEVFMRALQVLQLLCDNHQTRMRRVKSDVDVMRRMDMIAKVMEKKYLLEKKFLEEQSRKKMISGTNQVRMKHSNAMIHCYEQFVQFIQTIQSVV